MISGEIRFEDKTIFLDNKSWDVQYPIERVWQVGARVFVIYDRMAGPSWRQFQNLSAFDLDGNKLWVAEHPTSGTADCYYNWEESSDPNAIKVYNFAGFICYIASDTGKLLKSEFTK